MRRRSRIVQLRLFLLSAAASLCGAPTQLSGLFLQQKAFLLRLFHRLHELADILSSASIAVSGRVFVEGGKATEEDAKLGH